MYLHEDGQIKVSNDKWTLLVYKDLELIKNTILNNDKILDNILNTLEEDAPRMIAFKSEVKTHISLLLQISRSINTKYNEIIRDTNKYIYREKRGIFNGIGTVWKSITGNLDASDGEYYNDCINKITKDEYQIENLLKNQISVTTSVIKSFNSTIQKLQIDEETFNNDIKEIRKSIMDISDQLNYFQSQIDILNICESLMESYTFLENQIDDIINSITFARLKILHSSIITPNDLVDSLKHISQSLKRNNLPLPISATSIPQYLDIIELKAYQLDSKVVFVLNIPLVEPEEYTLYRIYPIPLLDHRTALHHILSTTYKYIARSDDSLLYIIIEDPEACKSTGRKTRICSNIFPYPIDSDAICEAQLLKQQDHLPRTCQSSLIMAKEYNINKLNLNFWLIIISDPLPLTIKCGNRDIITKILNNNTLLKLQSECIAFVGSTRIQGQKDINVYDNVTYNTFPIQIPYSCCSNIPEKIKIPNLKPLKLSKLNLEDLSVANHKLNEYSEQLNNLINEPFVKKHHGWFTILIIIVIVTLVLIYIFCKCKSRRRSRIGIAISHDDYPPSPPRNQVESTFSKWKKILPRRRPSIHLEEPIEEESFELNPNKNSV